MQNPSPMFGMDPWKESSRDNHFWKQQLGMLTQANATDVGPTTSLPTDAGPTSETGLVQAQRAVLSQKPHVSRSQLRSLTRIPPDAEHPTSGSRICTRATPV